MAEATYQIDVSSLADQFDLQAASVVYPSSFESDHVVLSFYVPINEDEMDIRAADAAMSDPARYSQADFDRELGLE